MEGQCNQGWATVSRSPCEKAQALPQGQGIGVLNLELDGLNSSPDSTTVSDLGAVIAFLSFSE